MISCNIVLSPPWAQQKKSGSPWDLTDGHKCNVLVQESEDGEGLI